MMTIEIQIEKKRIGQNIDTILIRIYNAFFALLLQDFILQA